MKLEENFFQEISCCVDIKPITSNRDREASWNIHLYSNDRYRFTPSSELCFKVSKPESAISVAKILKEKIFEEYYENEKPNTLTLSLNNYEKKNKKIGSDISRWVLFCGALTFFLPGIKVSRQF